jgi:beta-glucanase (GH16 family)
LRKVTACIAAAMVFLFLTNASAGGAWKLFWSDEFDSTALNEQTWTIGAGSAPNGEQETYTAGHDQPNSNIFVKNGCLNLVARNTGGITSGRINTQNKKNFMYGRMEARMRLPLTQGMWPAFWMLGSNFNTVWWPACGELDIMEGRGRLPNWTSGNYHFTNFDVFNQYTLPSGNVHDNFHIYAAEWSTDSIRWLCDSVSFASITKSRNPGLPFDKEFWFILNLAVGGNFDGNINSSTVFPESLIVDYVRVYHWDANAAAVAPPQRTGGHAAFTIADNEVTVALPARRAYALELFSVNGERVMQAAGAAESFSFTTAGLAPGVYCATVRGAFGTLSSRIMVRR